MPEMTLNITIKDGQIVLLPAAPPVKTTTVTYLSINTYTPEDGCDFTSINIHRNRLPAPGKTVGDSKARFYDHPTPSSMRRVMRVLAYRYLHGEHPEALP